jgi:hypothetical protein
MKNEEKMLELSTMHNAMLAKIAAVGKRELPKGVNTKKLEMAYDSLKDYVWVLRKI